MSLTLLLGSESSKTRFEFVVPEFYIDPFTSVYYVVELVAKFTKFTVDYFCSIYYDPAFYTSLSIFAFYILFSLEFTTALPIVVAAPNLAAVEPEAVALATFCEPLVAPPAIEYNERTLAFLAA